MRTDPIFTELARLRRSHGWSLREVARRAGVSDGAVGYAESGRRSPTLVVARQIAAAYGLTLTLTATGTPGMGRPTTAVPFVGGRDGTADEK